MAPYDCCCWRWASRESRLPCCGLLGLRGWRWPYFCSGQPTVLGGGQRGEGAAPARGNKLLVDCHTMQGRPQDGVCPSCRHVVSRSGLLLQADGVGRGESKAICSHVTFPISKLCFYNYWPRLPRELWPPQRAVLFHFCQQWVFSLCSCMKAFVSCLSSPAARCAGQAICHVLESRLSTPLPCAAVASCSAHQANTPPVFRSQMLGLCVTIACGVIRGWTPG